MKKVLLIGGAGFIGFNIAKYLVNERNYKITIADSFFRTGGKVDKEFDDFISKNKIQLISGDFTESKSFKKLDKNYDYIYMLASVVGVDYVNKIPHEIIRINTSLIFNTLEWLKKIKCKRVLFTSTSECYAGAVQAFNYPVPTSETVPLTIEDIRHPRFTYAVTKMLGESGFLNYSRMLDIECVIIRYHNVYGPRMGFKHVIPHLAQRFYNNEKPFKIYGHDQTRSFNYIDDAVIGTVLAIENGKNGEIYHIGDDIEISIEKLTRYVGELLKFKGKYIYAPTYEGSVQRRCPDISKSKKELKYFPSVNWKEGVKNTINWYISYLKKKPNLHESFYDKKNKK